MTEYTTYVAFDGSEFDDEDDCLAYERTMQATDYEDEIFFYDNNRKPIPLNVEDLDDIYFVNILAEKACQWFVDRCQDCGSTHPWSYNPYRKEEFPLTGFFYYSDEEWHHWQTEIERLRAISDYFQLFEED